jgi:acyl-CoA thioesterase-1
MSMIGRAWWAASLGVVLACGGAPPDEVDRPAGDAGVVEDTLPSGSGEPASGRTIVFFGTSLTAGLGVQPEEAYPAVVAGKVDSAGLDYEVVNLGSSGETSAGAVRRMEWVLGRRPMNVLVLETGANDGLRGLDPDSTRQNIQSIIDLVRARSPETRILLVQMEAPPNLGTRYTARFREMYGELARENGVGLIPFLLEGVAGVDTLNQGDGIHPTAVGHGIMAGLVWASLEPVLRQ